ncbi:MAG: hypothetical protein WC817_00550 [Patescibacteria group bacterium]|jgi:hypothetical protein
MNFWTENWKRMAGGLLLLAVLTHYVMGVGYFASLITATCMAGAVYARSWLIASTWKRTGNAVLAALVVFVAWRVATNYLPETMNTLRKNVSVTDSVSKQLTKGDTTGVSISAGRREFWQERAELKLRADMDLAFWRWNRYNTDDAGRQKEEAEAIASYRTRIDELERQFSMTPPTMSKVVEGVRTGASVAVGFDWRGWLMSFTTGEVMSYCIFVILVLAALRLAFGLWTSPGSILGRLGYWQQVAVAILIVAVASGTAVWGYSGRFLSDAVQAGAHKVLDGVVELKGKAILVNPEGTNVVLDGSEEMPIQVAIYHGLLQPVRLEHPETRVYACRLDDYGEEDGCGWGLRRLLEGSTTTTTMPPTAAPQPTATAGATPATAPVYVDGKATYTEWDGVLSAGEEVCTYGPTNTPQNKPLRILDAWGKSLLGLDEQGEEKLQVPGSGHTLGDYSGVICRQAVEDGTALRIRPGYAGT